MAFKIKGSHLVAIVLAAGIGGWMYTGNVVIGGQSSDSGSKPIAEREAERISELIKVRYYTVKPEARDKNLIVRGRTKASAVISVRAQVSGTLKKRLVNRGDKVIQNQIVCTVDIGARKAQLARAEAQLAKADADFQANASLVKKGIVSKNLLKTMQASLDTAKAGIAEAQLNVDRSKIRANAAGVVQDPIAQVGDMLAVGNTCITLVQSDPIKFSGQVSERDIDSIQIGAEANIKLVSGKFVKGTVRYISPTADEGTRTFLTEIEIPNSDGAIRDGMTAQAHIKLRAVQAFRLSPSWITLSDKGQVGVRIVDEASLVKFIEVELIAQTKTGFWVLGLEPGMRVISLGQEYVIEDQKVDPIADTLDLAGVKQ